MPLLSIHPPIKQQTTMGCNPIPTYPPQALKGSDDSSHQKNNIGQHHSIHGTEDPKPCGRPALIFTILRSAFAVKDLAMAKHLLVGCWVLLRSLFHPSSGLAFIGGPDKDVYGFPKLKKVFLWFGMVLLHGGSTPRSQRKYV